MCPYCGSELSFDSLGISKRLYTIIGVSGRPFIRSRGLLSFHSHLNLPKIHSRHPVARCFVSLRRVVTQMWPCIISKNSQTLQNSNWCGAGVRQYRSTTAIQLHDYILYLRALSAQLSANIKPIKLEAEKKQSTSLLKDGALVFKTVSNAVI